jgi:RNA polymerase sigma factor (sigma-70 family)
MTTDSELLQRFARTNSEDAFAELVRRHVNLVYSAALRQANGDAHLAQDVAQTVFTDLARKAASLARRESLTGWLYTSAHFAAGKIARTESRRREREEKFMRERNESGTGFQPVSSAPEADWNKIRPALDDAMHELKESDREAILLRYFENHPFAEVGAKLGLNENTARMRVERALEKLRGILSKRGVTTATALAYAISTNAVQTAPANLMATLTTISITAAGTGTITLLKIMTASKLKLAFSAIVVASAATTLMVQHQTQEKLRAENESLTQQLAQLQTDNENFSNRLAATNNSEKLPNEELNELLKLRGEVGKLREQTNALATLREENHQLRSTLLAQKKSETPRALRTVSQTDFPKESWTFAGYATPEAAMETWVWAMDTHNEKTMLASLVTEKQDEWRKLFESESPEEKFKSAPFSGYHIHAMENLSDTEATVNIVIDLHDGSKTGEQRYKFKKVGAEWRMAGDARD